MPREEGESHRDPIFFQPDAEKLFFVQRKADKLVRRGPREYFIVGRNPDGRPFETRLGAVALRIEGL